MNKELFMEIRLFNGLSQAEFAKSVGVSNATVCRIESGERSISDFIRSKVARKYDITSDEFKEWRERYHKLAKE